MTEVALDVRSTLKQAWFTKPCPALADLLDINYLAVAYS
jgi:hypothetical protein